MVLVSLYRSDAFDDYLVSLSLNFPVVSDVLPSWHLAGEGPVRWKGHLMLSLGEDVSGSPTLQDCRARDLHCLDAFEGADDSDQSGSVAC